MPDRPSLATTPDNIRSVRNTLLSLGQVPLPLALEKLVCIQLQEQKGRPSEHP
jgi:hypothetical protein